MSIKNALKEIDKEIAALKKARLKVAAHTKEKCDEDKHITKWYATGGSNGECVTYCVVCNKRWYGYD